MAIMEESVYNALLKYAIAARESRQYWHKWNKTVLGQWCSVVFGVNKYVVIFVSCVKNIQELVHVFPEEDGRLNHEAKKIKLSSSFSIHFWLIDWVSDCCLTPIQLNFSAISWCENKLIFNEMMMRSALY